MIIHIQLSEPKSPVWLHDSLRRTFDSSGTFDSFRYVFLISLFTFWCSCARGFESTSTGVTCNAFDLEKGTSEQYGVLDMQNFSRENGKSATLENLLDELWILVYAICSNSTTAGFFVCNQGSRKQKMPVGAEAPESSRNWPQYSEFCVLLHFYITIFENHWVPGHPQHPCLRGPCIRIRDICVL